MNQDQQKITTCVNEIEKIVRTNAVYSRMDKYIKRLRAQNSLDVLIQLNNNPVRYTLLHFFCIKKNLEKVKELLNGENKANILTKSSNGFSVLFLAIELFAEDSGYSLIIDELLKYSPQQQVLIQNSEGETALHKAVKTGKLELVKKLTLISNEQQFLIRSMSTQVIPLTLAIEKNAPTAVITELLKVGPETQIFCGNADGTLPIHWALYKGNQEVAQMLLKHKPEEQLRTRNLKNVTALHFAFDSGNYTLATWLITDYPFILSIKTKDGLLPLHNACKTKKLNVVKFLLANGAKDQIIIPHSDSGEGFIPLSSACELNLPEIAGELLTFEPEKQLLNIEPEHFTAVLSACYYGSLETLKILIQTIINNNLDPKKFLLARNNNGCFALELAVQNLAKIPNYPVQIIDTLLQLIPDEQLQMTDDDEWTALNIAVDKGNNAAVECLTHYMKKEHYLIPTQKGSTPFYNAAKEGHLSIIESLLKSGPKTEMLIGRHEGWLPIHIATENNRLPIVIRILKEDSNLSEAKTTDDELTPLHLAANFSSSSVLEHLLIQQKVNRLVQDKAGMISLHYASQNPQIECLNLLLQQQTEEQLFALTLDGTTCLHHAVMANEIEIVKFILSKAATNKIKLLNSQDKQGLTALHHACNRGFKNIVELLISENADVNITDLKKCTILHFATYNGQIETVKILINRAQHLLNAVNDLKSLPLHVACERGNIELVKILSHFSKEIIDQPDKFGRTPLFCATVFGHSSVVAYLATLNANTNSVVNIDEQIISPLRISIENLDVETTKVLVKTKANFDQIINVITQETCADLVNNLEDDIQKVFMDIINAQKLSVDSGVSRSTTVSSKKVQDTEGSSLLEKAVSGRRYLTSLGYTSQDIKDLEEATEDAKLKLKSNRNSIFSPSISLTAKKFTWCNNQFDNQNPQVFPIISPGGNNSFCYLDKILLSEQGCYNEQLTDTNFKFNGKSIKKLDTDKATINDYVTISSETKYVTYTHELKINKIDRILLFELKSDQSDACLYIGARFIKSGLHVNSQIRDIQRSGKSINKPIEITLPNQTKQSSLDNTV